MLLYSTEQARDLDRWAIEDLGISQAALMENAGQQVALAMEKAFGPLGNKAVVVVFGKGSNGGDGLVAARHLANCGARVLLLGSHAEAELAPACAAQFRTCRRMGLELAQDTAPCLAQADLVVDALLGTGGQGAASGMTALLIEAINAAAKPVVAVDLPSGLNADSGRPQGACVQASLTVTFASVKRGQALLPGAALCGSLVVADIGIPPRPALAATWHLLEGRELAALVPRRGAQAHKRNSGTLLVVAGSQAYPGAAYLAALAGLKAGAGMLHCAVPVTPAGLLRLRLPEALVHPLGQGREHLGMDDLPAILELAGQAQAAVVGPGLGRDPETLDLARALWRELAIPAVFDADALFALAGLPPLPSQGPRVITPHSGEMRRLMGGADPEADRPAAALGQAQARGCVVVLKGPRSLVASPEGGLAINPLGGPELATGGTGDVLAGLLGSLLAQGLSPLDAGRLAVYTHGLAGETLAKAEGVLLASELCSALPRALKRVAVG
jgi:NAD(P)H-hydrate epimerase